MKQARLNSTKLLSKYEDMLDPLDLNSLAKARQITVYVKTLEGENFCGWTAKWSFMGKQSRLRT